ncbi:MAG: hypothetical protein CSA79_02925 [Thiothrix nivea]|nr:MAG: hypothetical protein CSA79_02925 [Thiothrix nivea]
MKAWFSALSERERTLVLAGGFVLMALLAYFYGWRPLVSYQAGLERDIKLTIEDREFIKQAQQQVQFLEQAKQNEKVVDTSTSVQLLANPLLRRFKLDNQSNVGLRSEAKSKDIVSLRMDKAPFDALINFIGAMEHQHNIKVSNMALVPSKTVGLTNVQVTLER